MQVRLSGATESWHKPFLLHPCENMFQCSRTVLDFLEMFQNYANHDFQKFFPWTVIEPASRALLEQIKDFANPIFVLEQ